MLRSLSLISLTLASFLLAASPASSENLVWVDESADGSKIYVDRTSLRRQGQFVWYWEVLIRQVPDTEGAITTRIYRSADCNTDKVRIRQVIKHDRQKRLIRSQNYGDQGPVIKVQPNTLPYMALQFACEP